MFPSLSGRWIVPWLAVCVLLLFLFPVVQGPFQATHGPNTAFRARKAFMALILSIVRSGMNVMARFSLPARTLMGRTGLSLEVCDYAQYGAFDSMILRC